MQMHDEPGQIDVPAGQIVRLVYTFGGTISGDRMSGEVDLGEYGAATWKAWRHS